MIGVHNFCVASLWCIIPACVMKMDDTRLCCWQVLRDASNSEAAQSLDLLEPLQAQRHQAQELIDQNQHQEAIDVLTHVIEVVFCSLHRYIYKVKL